MIAVVPVRHGRLPLGAEETVDEAGGRVLLAGSGTAAAAAELAGATAELLRWEAGEYRPGGWAAALAPVLADEDVVVLPGSPDGRDLAPRLALALGRPLYAPALAVTGRGATVVRGDGLATWEATFDGPVVATLQPGSRGVDRRRRPPPIERVVTVGVPAVADAVCTTVREADPATIDLAEARRIVAAGAGLGSPDSVDLLARVAAALGCATGATRVVADAGWVSFDRQIGTTGVVVDPDLYVAVGVSGAVQHVSGIGAPRDVVAVNTDASCPMMAMADLAIVTDGPAFVRALAGRLGLDTEGGRTASGGTRDG